MHSYWFLRFYFTEWSLKVIFSVSEDVNIWWSKGENDITLHWNLLLLFYAQISIFNNCSCYVKTSTKHYDITLMTFLTGSNKGLTSLCPFKQVQDSVMGCVYFLFDKLSVWHGEFIIIIELYSQLISVNCQKHIKIIITCLQNAF